jgi:hypothetical protein
MFVHVRCWKIVGGNSQPEASIYHIIRKHGLYIFPPERTECRSSLPGVLIDFSFSQVLCSAWKDDAMNVSSAVLTSCNT